MSLGELIVRFCSQIQILEITTRNEEEIKDKLCVIPQRTINKDITVMKWIKAQVLSFFLIITTKCYVDCKSVSKDLYSV